MAVPAVTGRLVFQHTMAITTRTIAATDSFRGVEGFTSCLVIHDDVVQQQEFGKFKGIDIRVTTGIPDVV